MNKSNIAKTFLIVSIIILALVVSSLSFAAGTSKSVSKSSDEKRAIANIHFDSGKKLQDSQQFKAATEEYEKTVKADSSYPEAWSNLGYCLRKQGDFKKAVKAYKKAIQLDPELAEAHEYLGEAYAEMGNMELAKKELSILKNLDSKEADELAAFIEQKM